MNPMTMPGPTQADGLRDFSVDMRPKKFQLDPDVFEAPPVIPGGTIRKISELYGPGSEVGTGSAAQSLDQVANAFRLLMPGPHGERFVARLLSDGGPDDPPPIDLTRQAVPVLMWLLEIYGLRPTSPSSASADGSTTGNTPNDGTGTTDGASPTESATT